MCGIFGAHGVLPNEHDRLRSLAKRQAHRGPDAFGEWYHEPSRLYFAHNRLSIIDLSNASAQPFHTDAGVLLSNGEIYNYIELRAELARQGVSFRTTGDTEVLAAVLATWGLEGLHRVRGMFAFAYWSWADRKLVLCRDRFGIKPLFVAEHGGATYFSSEIEPLRDAGHWCEPDEEARAIYHLLNYLPAPFTFYRKILKVPPGHLVRVDEGGYALERWYRLEPRAHGDLTELMRRSVREHLRCDVDYGVFLSGGLDSNIVAALASDVAPGRLRTFSIGFPAFPAFDESKWAKLGAAHLGAEHHQFDVDAAELGAGEPPAPRNA